YQIHIHNVILFFRSTRRQHLVNLREKVLERIRKTEKVKEEFITETLIEFQENEMLREKTAR
ncbi:MAG: hypothetical protein QG641_2651, partial [Candidatus Poribacteria bacterium]|nr:hypothetical protein [Candidatus Poribacteria bacterium]